MSLTRTTCFAFLLLGWLVMPLPAQTPCGAWLDMPGGSDPLATPTAFAVDTAAHELYLLESCPCGPLDIYHPAFFRLVNSSWSPVGQDFPEGILLGMDVLDAGGGPALHAWGSLQSPPQPIPSAFMKLVGNTWVSAGAPGLMSLRDVVVFDDGSGPAYHAAWRDGVAKLVGGAWVDIGATIPATGAVRVLLVHDSGNGPALYAAGRFTSIGGVAAEGIARWDGTSWSALATGLSSTSPVVTDVTYLRSLHDFAGPALYAAGRFTTAGGAPANNVARFGGGAWTPIGTGLPADVAITGLEWFDEGLGTGPHLIASGSVDGISSSGFLLRREGATWSSLPAFPSPYAFRGGITAVFDRPATSGRDLVVVGWSPAPERTFFALEACASTGEIVCVGDGSIGPCPCGNESAPSERAGCDHSFGHGGALRARGNASLSADTLALDGSAMPDSSALYFQGASIHAAAAFGDGIRCVGGPFVRFTTKTNVGGASTFPSGSDLPVSVKGNVLAPGVRNYAVWYRNAAPFCTSDTFNHTNAVTILWGP